MGRFAKSDAEKRAKGTFDARYSEAARVERKAETVVPFPVLQEIPACAFPLDVEGKKLYDDLTRTLFEEKRLTVTSQMEIALLALGMSEVRRKIASGGFVAVGVIVKLTERLDRLKSDAVDRAYAGSIVPDRQNKFSRAGFSSRHR